MDLFFPIALFVILAGVIAYTLATYYASSKRIKGIVLIIAFIVTIPVIGLSVFAIVSDSFGEATKMWAMGAGAAALGFWFKNPTRDFVDG